MARRGGTKKPKKRAGSGRQGRWWKKGDKFIVDYIEYAETAIVGGTRMWVYNTKWYLYSRSENTGETASTFAECEHPILERFWKSVKRRIPPGCVEPDTGMDTDPYRIVYSPVSYRKREAAETLDMCLQEALYEDNPVENDLQEELYEANPMEGDLQEALYEDNPVENDLQEELYEANPMESDLQEELYEINPVESESQSSPETADEGTPSEGSPEMDVQDDSDAEVEALLVTDALSHLVIAEATFNIPPTALINPPPTAAIKPPMSHSDLAEHSFQYLKEAAENFCNTRTVAPHDTIILRCNPFPVDYRAVQLDHEAQTSAPMPAGGSFHSTPGVTVYEKATWALRRASVVAEEKRGRERTGKRMMFYREAYSKAVPEPIRMHLDQLPPGMELGYDESDKATSDAAAFFEEYIQEPPMVTAHELAAQCSDTGLNI